MKETDPFETIFSLMNEMEAQYVEIVGIPVQFVPANKLEEEAIQEAIEVSYGMTKTRVPRPEHLVAIKLQVGRDRDVWHLHMLLEQTHIDHDYLRNILERHGLTEKWEIFQARGR